MQQDWIAQHQVGNLNNQQVSDAGLVRISGGNGDPTLPAEVQPPPPSLMDKVGTALLPKTPTDLALLVVPELGELAEGAIRMAEVASAGRAGEEAAQAVEDLGTKEYFKAGGRSRFTDGSTSTAVNEVKNVAKQGWTRQLKDEAGHAAATGRTFQLWLRGSTQLSGPLQAAASALKVLIRWF